MRRVRWLLLTIILLLLAVLGVTYTVRQEAQRRAAPKAPRSLPLNLNATANDWHWSQTSGDKTVVEVRAKDFRQVREPNQFELTGVDLRLYHKDGKSYDHVTSAKATFDLEAGTLFSDGEVEITMGLRAEEPEAGRLVSIHSSGVSFEARTGKAVTDREAAFTFENGDGKATGAAYDPGTRELLLRSQVELWWRGNRPGAIPMRIEAGELLYKELESKVYLKPWARLKRANLTLETRDAAVTLEKGVIRMVDALEGRGADLYPRREIEYAADRLLMHLDADSKAERIEGDGNARLAASSAAARTETRAQRVEMFFRRDGEESLLERVLASGGAVIESQPTLPPNTPGPDTRVLRSETIEMRMRESGEEIDTLATHAPGVLELLPNRPGSRKRRVEGERIEAAYQPGNQIRSFRATEAATRTENEVKKGKPAPPSLTWSKFLLAEFTPKTAELERIEQWENFRYEEGERKAQAARAVLEQKTNLITLTGSARASDPSGSTAADRILLDQGSNDVIADGNVTSTRLPDGKGGQSSMVDDSQPVQARAARMRSRRNNRLIRYEGNAVLWQGASRIEADAIDINRENRTLHASGKVFTQLAGKPPAPKPGQPGPKDRGTIFTLVRAAELDYSEKDRLAHYRGGATLQRARLEVAAREIRAYLNPKDAGTELDRAYADGAVRIVEKSRDRTRLGDSEHAEYYAGEEKIVLKGGDPKLDDSRRGVTRGRELTYYPQDDRLLVNGQPARPATSLIRRK